MAAIAALLLAAGESTRMGEIKALLPWQGTTLLEYQVNSLAAAGISRIVVVVGHQAQSLESLLKDRPSVYCAYNPDYRRGKITSVKTGVRALLGPVSQGQSHSRGQLRGGRPTRDETPVENALLVLNVDQPRSTAIISYLIDANGRSGALITIPTYRDKGGHPVIFSASLWGEMLEISEDTQGLKAVVRRYSAETDRVEMNTFEVLLDLNTPEEYQRAWDFLGSHRPEKG